MLLPQNQSDNVTSLFGVDSGTSEIVNELVSVDESCLKPVVANTEQSEPTYANLELVQSSMEGENREHLEDSHLLDDILN